MSSQAFRCTGLVVLSCWLVAARRRRNPSPASSRSVPISQWGSPWSG